MAGLTQFIESCACGASNIRDLISLLCISWPYSFFAVLWFSS
jgi:hypothetical protein